MTVRELREFLRDKPDELPVFVETDMAQLENPLPRVQCAGDGDFDVDMLADFGVLYGVEFIIL